MSPKILKEKVCLYLIGCRLVNVFKVSLIAFFFVFTISVSFSQTITLSKTVSDATPDVEDVFNYTLDLSCSSSTGPCRGVEIRDTLPQFVQFLNFSSPLPSGVASATYDAVSREAVITFDNNTSAGSTIQLNIQVQFPDGTLDGSVAVNTAYATSVNAGNDVSTAIATAQNGMPTGDFPDDKGGGTRQVTGGYQYWQITVGNIGFTTIDNYSIVDTIPAGLTLDQIRTPEFSNVDHSGSLYYQRSDDPGVWHLWSGINLNNRQNHYVSGLGLPVGEYVSIVRLDLNTVPGTGIYNPYIYPDGFRSGWTLYAFETGGRVIGDTYTNCAYYTGTSGGVSISDVDCVTTTIEEPEDEVGGNGYTIGDDGNEQELFSIEDTMDVAIEFYSESNMGYDIVGGVMAVVLPPNVSYIPNSWYFDWGEDNADFQTPIVETSTLVDGRELVRFVFDSTHNNSFTIEPNPYWEGFRIVLSTFISPAAMQGSYDLEYYYYAAHSTHDNCNVNDVDNYLGGYSTYVCNENQSIDIIRPPGSAGLESRMEVIGTLDTDYSQYPERALTVPGGISDYKITIKNSNAKRINRLVFITELPHIGDSEVLDENTPRYSDWQPAFAEAVTGLPSGLSVEYSTVDNPCRDDLAGSNPTPFPTGCTTAAWTSTPPVDITDVTALRFDYGNTRLNQNDSLVVNFSMRSPVDAFPDTSIAWNSFAYTARNFDDNVDLLPAEPIKVGIELRPGNVPIVGDYVWQDSILNGRQDATESGIDGIRVELYHDVDNDGIAEPGGPDTLELWTITSAGGKYLFSDFEYGRYFIVFTDIPTGFIPTYQDVTTDDKDSDGLITDVMLFDNTVETYDIDLGLYDGILPDYCSLGSDEDGDTIGSFCDLDDDNDGIPDVDEDNILTNDYLPPCSLEPEFDFSGGVLISGDTLQEGAVYRYTNVIPGVDALVTIEDLVNLTLPTMDDEAINPSWFKPQSAFSLARANSEAYSQYLFSFVKTGTSVDTVLSAINLLFVDIDGNPNYSEMNWTENPTSFTYNDPTDLTFTRDNDVKAVTDTTEYPSITDSFPQANFYVRYVHVSQFRARFGVHTNVDNTSSDGRYHGLIFKCPDTFTTPVTVSIDVDEDGIPNNLDLDSDNDGILDVYEAGHGMTAGADGRILNVNASVGTNGLDDRVETIADSDIINYAISDSEPAPDGTYDPYELDSDDDGCFDVAEANFADTDDDGIVEVGTPTVDGDGLVTTHSYPAPPNNFWQDPSFNVCEGCKTAIMNPHVMYFHNKK